MADLSVAVSRPKRNTFVSAVTPSREEQFKAGRRAYMAGKRITFCTTDAMTQGYLHQEGVCADAYWSQMMAQADDTPSADREWVRTHC